MKKLFTLFLIFTSFIALAQAPQKISYQAVARQSSGLVLPNQPIGVEFKIYQSSTSGTLVYSETHNTTTNSFGLFSLFIGGGSPNTGSFAAINWSTGNYWVETLIDPTGGTAYTSVGAQQLMSVPYALYAETSGNANSTPTITGVGIASVTPTTGNSFTVSVTTPTLTGIGSTTVTGTYPSFTINTPMASTAVTPTITGTGATTVSGTYPTLTINSPTVQSYSAGNGIDITSGVITNTATSVTPTITGTGATTVTGTYPSLTINTPTVQSYSAGNGIDITGGVITNTSVAAVTPTINGSGATTVTGTYPTLTINSPTVQSYSAGNGIDITGGVITNTATAIAPTITGIGTATVTSSGNTFTVNTPASTTYTNGTGISITSGSIIANTSPNQTITITGTGASTVTGVYPNFTVSSPTVAASITPTLTGAGNATVTGAYPNQTVSVTAQSLSIATNTISLSNGGGSVVVAPAVLSYTSVTNVIKLTDGSSVNTFTLNSNPSTTLTPGTNVVLVGSAPNYTVSSVTPSIIGTGATTVTGTYPNLTINTPASTTYTNGAGISITSGSVITNTSPNQTVTLIGTGASTVTGIYPNFTVSSPTIAAAITPTIIGTGASTVISSGNTFTVNTPVTNIAPGNNIAISGASPNYTVSAVTPTLSGLGGITVSGAYPSQNISYAPTPQVLSIASNSIISLSSGGGSVTIPTQTLALTGTTLTSGVSTNSVNLSALSVWTSSVGVLFPTTLTNSVAIGTSGPTTGKFEILHTATQPNPTMHLRETSGNLNRIKFSNNTVANKFFETAAQTAAIDANGAYSINYFDGTTYKPVFLVMGDRKVNINNLNTVLASFHVMENASTAGGGIVSEGFAQAGQIILARNNQPALAARLAVVSGDELGRIIFSGYNGGAFNGSTAKISAFATENYTGSNQGSEMLFSTVKTGGLTTLDLLKLGANGDVIINPNNNVNSTTLFVKGKIRLDSSITMAAYNFIPPVSSINEGRIYYDRASNKFKVSENSGAYVNLTGSSLSPWTQGAGLTFLTNMGDKVGIGTNTPTSQLHVSGISDPLQITLQNGGGNFKTGFNIKTALNEWFIGQESTSASGFRITDIGSSAVRLQIDPLGNVGIGNTAPVEKLEVNGNIQIPGVNEYKYASPKTKYLNIPVNSLKSIDRSYFVTIYSYVGGSDGDAGYAYIDYGGSPGLKAIATTPVFLPDGAIVTEVLVRYYDNDATYDGTFSLEQKGMNTIVSQTMASFTTLGNGSAPASPALQSITAIAYNPIDNANYSYYFKFKSTQLNSNIGIFDIRIAYTVIKAD